MTFFFVIWIATEWSCPWGLGRAPELVKGIVCERSQRVGHEWTPRRDDVNKILMRLGPGASYSVVEVRGGRHSTRTVIWHPEVR